MNEEEHREKMIDRQWGLLAAIAQGYCQNPEFACTAYQPLADMIVRTANAVKETCHMTPFKAVQKPADQDEVVNVKIEPMKKGKKPKE